MTALKAAAPQPNDYLVPTPQRHVFAVAFWIVAGLIALGITGLWLADGGISAVTNLGEAITSAGRITGLLGAYLILLQVLLLARLPWIERAAGFDRLTVWHRLNGKVALILILAHVVLITIGYAMTDRLSIGGEISALFKYYPGMLGATVGTALMVIIVGMSLVIVRKHLRYEFWYAVHLTAYLAIGLAWIHQIPTGNDLVTNARAAALWTALYIATLVLLVLFRLAWPAINTFRHRLRVVSVTQEAPGVTTMQIAGRHLDRLGVRAGQFFEWRFLTRNGWNEAHPFSLSAAPNGRDLRITVKNSGDFTSRMASIRPGTSVIAEGPFGVFTAEVRRKERALLIAGGIGITPIRALAEEMPGDIVLIYRVMNESDVIFRRELDALARNRGIDVRYVIGDHRVAGNETLLSAEHLREMVPDIVDRDVYLCGPPAMVSLLESNIRRTGLPAKQLHIEKFAL